MIFPQTLFSLNLTIFHRYLWGWLFGVVFFILCIYVRLLRESRFFKLTGARYSKLEVLCSLLPSLIVICLMLPSLYLLYRRNMLDTARELTLKVVGHQWYWNYEYCDFSDLAFERFMSGLEDLGPGGYRLLETDKHLIVPHGVNLRLCFTSGDVIHSWALPAAGVKVDCIPGILNTCVLRFLFVGLTYGQCREICGANHRFIPVVVEILPWESFFFWLNYFL